MINFTWKDFEEADGKLEPLARDILDLQKKLEEAEKIYKIAEEERNFIGDWLQRNGVSKELQEEIEDRINPIGF